MAVSKALSLEAARAALRPVAGRRHAICSQRLCAVVTDRAAPARRSLERAKAKGEGRRNGAISGGAGKLAHVPSPW